MNDFVHWLGRACFWLYCALRKVAPKPKYDKLKDSNPNCPCVDCERYFKKHKDYSLKRL